MSKIAFMKPLLACLALCASVQAEPVLKATAIVTPVPSIKASTIDAPFDMAWHTIDGGGGPVTNGAFQLNGTVGQPEPCVMLGGAFEMTGGYWFGSPPPPPACYPDCDGDTVLSVDDFICFQTMFALSDPYADCDQDLFLSIDDFICFQTLFALGC